MTARKSLRLFLLAAAAGLLLWGSWLYAGQVRRQQRDRALVRAVKSDRLPAALALLDEGADPSARTPPLSAFQKAKVFYYGKKHGVTMPAWGHMDDANQGWSVLEIAVMRGDPALVSALLFKGADLAYKDKAGKTATDWAQHLSGTSEMAFPGGSTYRRILASLKAAAARPRQSGSAP